MVATTGVWKRGLTRAKARKKSPSRAIARITREAPSMMPFIAPRIDTEISSESASAAPGPKAVLDGERGDPVGAADRLGGEHGVVGDVDHQVDRRR